MAKPVDLTKLSAAKLHVEIEKRDARASALLNATIQAGYGETRHNTIVEMVRVGTAEQLLVDYVAAFNERQAATNELDDRLRWHGSDKPIKRQLLA